MLKNRYLIRQTLCSAPFWVLTCLLSFAGFAAEQPLLTVEQAQQQYFPGNSEFTLVSTALGEDILDQVEEQADVRVSAKRIKAWQVVQDGSEQGWFFTDKVIGKHEFISYALAVDNEGKVKGVEILEYLETHGWQVKNAEWRAQFLNKNLLSNGIKLGDDIDGISGATLSCRNVTDGIRKLLILSQYLKKSGGQG